MGFNTTFVILNDALHNIKEDKDFGRKVFDAACEAYQTAKPAIIYSGAGNCGEAVESHHADEVRLLVAGGNCAIDLGYVGRYGLMWNDSRIELLREIRRMALREIKKLEAKKK